MPEYSVFLSHAAADKPLVESVLAELRDSLPAIKFWVDFESIKPGDDWANEIVSIADGSSLFLVFGTKTAFESRWVQHEIGIGLRNHLFEKAPLIFLAFDKDSIPSDLRRYQFIDFENSTMGMKELKEFICDQFIPRHRTRIQTRDSMAYIQKSGTIFNYVSCPDILSKLAKAELRKRICKRLNRNQVAVVWFDALESTMDDELPNQPLQNCVVGLIDRCFRQDRTTELFSSLCDDHPQIANPT